jgi:histone deacetylase 8
VAALRLLAPAGRVQPVRHAAAPEAALLEYHAASYVDALRGAAPSEAALTAAGLTHDCPRFDGCYEYARLVAGGSLAAADALMPLPGRAGQVRIPRVAIHWDGGRHHAARASAAGFCYVNDAVLAVQRLLSRGCTRVMYVDIDVHHCDAVAGAFYRTDAVLVVSLHMHGPGVYPGTGAGSERGAGRGAGHTLNLPLAPGLRDALFVRAFDTLAGGAASLYRPDAVVLCAGADGLAGDPLGAWCLTPAALAAAAASARRWSAPLLVLGGGGYNEPNAARAFAAMTAALAGAPPELMAPDSAVPDHEHLLAYGPSFAMWEAQAMRADENDVAEVMARCAELLAVLREQYVDDDAAEQEEEDAAARAASADACCAAAPAAALREPPLVAA